MELSEVSSWLDQYLNQMEIKEVHKEMMVNYSDGNCRMDKIRSFIIIDLSRAKHSLNLSKVQRYSLNWAVKDSQ